LQVSGFTFHVCRLPFHDSRLTIADSRLPEKASGR